MERSERLRSLGETMAFNFHNPFIGQSIDVLVERVKDGIATGYSKHYIPVEFQSLENLQGQIISMKATQATSSGLLVI